MAALTDRGYGTSHRKTRDRLRPVVEAGQAVCVRCVTTIAPPGEPCPRCGRETVAGRPSPGKCGWDLGHDDDDRTLTVGAEHSCCNRRAGARKGGKATARKRRVYVWSRRWLDDV